MSVFTRTTRSRITVFACSAALLLTGCGIDTADIEARLSPGENYSDEDIDRNTGIAHCGIIGNLLLGNVPITVENVGEIQETLTFLAADGVGAVKPIAQHMLDSIAGEKFSDAEEQEVFDNYRDFCEDYTVD